MLLKLILSRVSFFKKQEIHLLEKAIKEAELNTSGEVRIHLEKRCGKDVLDRAAKVFSNLSMHKTKLRNGVLFYLAYESHKFAIIGDAGINTRVPPNFWDQIKEEMQSNFKKGDFFRGLKNGVLQSGKALKEHFPYQSDDVNELSDDISMGDE
jgi:uncharacterized membrane protein